MPIHPKELFKKPSDFMIGAVKLEDIPGWTLPELAFAGRSNVGKSSLVNALTQRKSLARTSKTPGCTRQVNFFSIGGALHLADLPGYGYAKASGHDIKGWNRLIHDYLLGRPNLRQVFLLIDGRHGVKPNDEEIMTRLDDAAVSYQVVLTKADKQKADVLDKIKDSIEAMGTNHPALHPEVLITSSVNHKGLDILRARMASFC